MKNKEVKSTRVLELKDIDTERRTGLIAHSVFTVIDRGKDQVLPTAFDEQYSKNPKIDFLFNHEEEQVVGPVTRVFRDQQKAYTAVKFGKWTLGDDVLEMADSGVLKGASMGYLPEQKEYTLVKGERVRRLVKIWHKETSLLTKTPMNPEAGLVTYTKAEDVANVVTDMRQHIAKMEKFYRNARASDDCLKQIHQDIMEAKSILTGYEQTMEESFTTQLYELSSKYFGKESKDYAQQLQALYQNVKSDNQSALFSKKVMELASKINPKPKTKADYIRELQNLIS